MKLALFKGPPKQREHLFDHYLYRAVTLGKYSHCELVIDGWCWSISTNTNSVRRRPGGDRLDLTRWDVIDVPMHSEKQALHWFLEHEGQGIDRAGWKRFVIPFYPVYDNEWSCSGAIAASWGLPKAHQWSPQQLKDHVLSFT